MNLLSCENPLLDEHINNLLTMSPDNPADQSIEVVLLRVTDEEIRRLVRETLEWGNEIRRSLERPKAWLARNPAPWTSQQADEWWAINGEFLNLNSTRDTRFNVLATLIENYTVAE